MEALKPLLTLAC